MNAPWLKDGVTIEMRGQGEPSGIVAGNDLAWSFVNGHRAARLATGAEGVTAEGVPRAADPPVPNNAFTCRAAPRRNRRSSRLLTSPDEARAAMTACEASTSRMTKPASDHVPSSRSDFIPS